MGRIAHCGIQRWVLFRESREDEQDNPLDDTIFAAYPLWMELSVDGEALAPTHPIQSVPYANISGLAENLDGGSVTPVKSPSTVSQ